MDGPRQTIKEVRREARGAKNPQAPRPWSLVPLSLVHYLLLLAAGLLLFVNNLGGPSLWDLDEGRNATAAMEMMETGNFVVPTFNARLRVDKPILHYWLLVGSFQVFGINEFAVRFPSALAALGTLFCC